MGSSKRERKRRNKIAGAPVRIVVCTYPSPTIDPAVDLLKSAVLYGDEVVLHSPIAAALGSIAAVANGDESELAEFVAELSPELAQQMGELDDAALGVTGRSLFAELVNPRSLVRAMLLRNPQLRGSLDFDELDSVIAEAKSKFEAIADEQLETAGFGDVSSAFDAGVLKIAPFDFADDMEADYARNLDELLNDPTSYPVFDDKLAEFVNMTLAKGRVRQNTFNRARGAQAATADRLLAHLPTFPLAKMDEIVDIRDELRAPLVRFRAEMIAITADYDLDPLNAEYDQQVVELWHQRVAPHLLELDEIVQQGSIARQYGVAAASKLASPATMFAVGAMTGNLTAGAVAAGGTAVLATASGIKDARHDRKKKQSQNPYFFLHETQRQLDT